ncbi:MAG TPA: HNH endonuclease [Coleofasciculaceae cyanobacterium]|jgi:hypothetical protein
MGKRLTIEEAKRRVEAIGYTLLDSDWISAHTNMHIQCERSHNFQMTMNNFNKGQKCPHCHREDANERKNGLVELSDSLGIDTSRFILQNLCSRGHEWNGTGKSLGFADNGHCVECNRMKCSQRYEKKREEYLAKSAEWRKRHKDKLQKYFIEYHQQNREKRNQASKEVYQRNRKHYIDYQRSYKRTHPEMVKVSSAKYRHKRRAQLCKNHSVKYSCSDLRKRLKDFNNTCAYCGSADRITFDHLIAVACGGADCIGNLVPACLSCNSSKADKDSLEWYQKQSFFSRKRWNTILNILGKTKENYNQIPLF